MPGRIRLPSVSSPAPNDGPRTNATLVPCFGANRLTATTALSALVIVPFSNSDEPPTATMVPLPSGMATINASLPTVKQLVDVAGGRNTNALSTLTFAAPESARIEQLPAAMACSVTRPEPSVPPSFGANDDCGSA